MTNRGGARAVFAALYLAAALAAGRAHAASPGAADVVSEFYATLLQTMQQGPALGAGGRYSKFEPAVRKTFDVALMTRLVVGQSWGSLSAGQQQQITAAFERYVAATYADRFDSYSGELLNVTGQRALGAGIIVRTRIVKSNGEAVGIDYLMFRNGDGWRISDVYLDGTISELATRRSEFSAILRDRGVTGLITALDKKTELLSGAIRNAS
jgi:phospholipid transport system substrate-binding protein